MLAAQLAVIMKPSRAESCALRIEDEFEETEKRDLPPPVTADGLLGRIPPKEEHLLVVQLEKADGAGQWHKRRAILTAKSLVLSRLEDEYVREEIYLNLIEEIQAIPSTSSDDRTLSSLVCESSIFHLSEKSTSGLSRQDRKQDPDKN